MQELEKVLEEIDAIKTGFDTECASECDFFDWSCGACVGECDEYIKEKVKEIIRKHMNDGWISVEERLPDEYDGLVLAQVSGKPRENITLNNALQLACYISEAGEGWIVEEYPEWENPNVIAWRPLPEPYRPEGKEEPQDWRESMLKKFDRRE